MANTKSAKKAIRVTERRTTINKRVKAQFKTAIKAVKTAVEKGNKKDANELLATAYKKIDKAGKSFLHKNTAARYKSRLASLVNKL